jgi:hypothetical protein
MQPLIKIKFAILEGVRQRLRAAPPKDRTPEEVTKSEAVRLLLPEITELLSKGHELQDIASLLSESGVPVSEWTVKNILGEAEEQTKAVHEARGKGGRRKSRVELMRAPSDGSARPPAGSRRNANRGSPDRSEETPETQSRSRSGSQSETQSGSQSEEAPVSSPTNSASGSTVAVASQGVLESGERPAARTPGRPSTLSESEGSSEPRTAPARRTGAEPGNDSQSKAQRRAAFIVRPDTERI